MKDILIDLLFTGIFTLVGIIAFYFRKSARKQIEAVTGLETSLINDLVPDKQVEVNGKAGSYNLLDAPGVNKKCVYYEYIIKERRTKKDSQGRTSYDWVRIGSGTSDENFMVIDDTGIVMVDPSGADMDVTLFGSVPYGVGGVDSGVIPSAIFRGIASNFINPVNIIVSGIEENQDLYVQGFTRMIEGQLQITKGKSGFIISTKSEEELVKSLKTRAVLAGLFGIVCFGVAVFMAVTAVNTYLG